MLSRSFAILLASILSALSTASPADYFRITVVDEDTSRGVPLIQLTASGGVAHITDSAGVIAFHEPALMDRDVHFMVEGHGYSFPPDGFGMRGLTLRTDTGSSAVVVVQRQNIAERLYRVTGSGIYHHSYLLGDTSPIKEPLLNSGVVGQDSVMTAYHRGRIFWLWGDTGSPGHPLSANFMTTCAWSDFETSGGLDPDVGVNLEYITDGQFVKRMVDVPERGVYWLHSLLAVPDKEGRDHLMAGYSKIRPPLSTDSRGWMEFDDAREVFVPFRQDNMDALILGDGHVYRVQKDDGEYFYFPSSTHFTRLPASYESIKTGSFEAWSCLKEGRVDEATTRGVDRDKSGRLRYSWQRDAQPVGFAEQEKLTSAGLLHENEQWFAFRDILSGKTVRPHANTVQWNPYRNRWIMIFSEILGSSVLGETWYAEADSPVGPWAYARKIVTHNQYSFYNPYLHPAFTRDDGRVVYFEGTYTMLFSGTTVPTPRYDYNQIMYKLDLDDPRLALPVAVYEAETAGRFEYRVRGPEETSTTLPAAPPAFYAQDRPSTFTVAIHRLKDAGGTRLTAADSPGEGAEVAFHAIRSDAGEQFEGAVPLYEFRGNGMYRYGTSDSRLPSELQRAAAPLCYVWLAPGSNVSANY